MYVYVYICQIESVPENLLMAEWQAFVDEVINLRLRETQGISWAAEC